MRVAVARRLTAPSCFVLRLRTALADHRGCRGTGRRPGRESGVRARRRPVRWGHGARAASVRPVRAHSAHGSPRARARAAKKALRLANHVHGPSPCPYLARSYGRAYGSCECRSRIARPEITHLALSLTYRRMVARLTHSRSVHIPNPRLSTSYARTNSSSVARAPGPRLSAGAGAPTAARLRVSKHW